MSEIAPHVHVPDNSVPPDFHGDRPCLICPLPKGNKRVHVDVLPVDAKTRAAGDDGRGGE